MVSFDFHFPFNIFSPSNNTMNAKVFGGTKVQQGFCFRKLTADVSSD